MSIFGTAANKVGPAEPCVRPCSGVTWTNGDALSDSWLELRYREHFSGLEIQSPHPYRRHRGFGGRCPSGRLHHLDPRAHPRSRGHSRPDRYGHGSSRHDPYTDARPNSHPRVNGFPQTAGLASPPATLTPSPVPTATPIPTPSIATPRPEPRPPPLGRPCSEFGEVKFTVPPMDLETIFYIRPMGAISGGHTTPTGHFYIHPTNRGRPPPPYEVRVVADGHIVGIDTMSGHLRPAPEGQSGLVEDYFVEIYHSCTLITVYIHLNGLAPEILDVTGEFQRGSRWNWSPREPPIPVTAGQVIGKVGSSFDFSVHDTEVTLTGFVTPSYYEGRIDTVDPFDYFEEPLRTRLLEKNLRAAEPRGGRIDFDIDGRLVGNWFLTGTESYNERSALSFVYDYLDPTQIRISVGGLVERRGWGVRGIAPDPADVTPASGLIKYEITATGWVVAATGEPWSEGTRHPGSELRGVNGETRGSLLVQMLEDRRIKLEVFLGQAPDQVQGFTDAARIYRR